MNKFLMSSAEATKYSATVKGFLLAILPILMALTGLNEIDANSLVEVITNIIYFGTSLIAVGQIAYGLARKLYLQRWSAE